MTLWYFFCFPSVHQPHSRMGPGCLCGVGISPVTLLGHGGSCFPTPATGLPLFPMGAGCCSSSCMYKSDCKMQGGKGGPTHPQLLFPPSHQDFSLDGAGCASFTCDLPAVAVARWRMQLVGCRGCSWPLQGDTVPPLPRRGHHECTVLTSSFSTGCGGNAISVRCFSSRASGWFLHPAKACLCGSSGRRSQ